MQKVEPQIFLSSSIVEDFLPLMEDMALKLAACSSLLLNGGTGHPVILENVEKYQKYHEEMRGIHNWAAQYVCLGRETLHRDEFAHLDFMIRKHFMTVQDNCVYSKNLPMKNIAYAEIVLESVSALRNLYRRLHYDFILDIKGKYEQSAVHA